MHIFNKLFRSESEEGATVIEYVLLAALIAVALIAAITLLQGDISETFSTVGSALDSA